MRQGQGRDAGVAVGVLVLCLSAVACTEGNRTAIDTSESSGDPAASTTVSSPDTTAGVESTVTAPVTTAGVESTVTAPVTTAASDPPPDGEAVPSVEASAPSSGSDPAAFEFRDPESVEAWSTVNDPVMGGRSVGEVSWEAGALVFRGELSLENNGGFASLVSPVDGAIGAALAGADGLALTGEGDGKTYVIQLRAGEPAVSYATRFVGAESFELVVPFVDFEAVNRFLEPLAGAPGLDPASVVQVAVYVLDKQDGPFELRLLSVG